MQDLLDVSIPAVVLIPLFIVCVALWRCYQWSVQSSELRRAEFLRLQLLARDEKERAEKAYENYNRLQGFVRRRQDAQQRPVDYRFNNRSQPATGNDYPRRAQFEQDHVYGAGVRYPTRQADEEIRQKKWADERRRAGVDEFRIKQVEEYNRTKQAELEVLRRKQAVAEEEERRQRAIADTEIRLRLAEEADRKRFEAEVERKRLAEDAERKRFEAEVERKRLAEYADRMRIEAEVERKRIAEDAERKRIEAEAERKRLAEDAERKRIEYEEEEKKRRAEMDEINRKAVLEAQAKILTEERENMRTEVDEINHKGTQGYICIICLKRTKRRCSRCKDVFYCSRECQVQHWHGGHKNECTLLYSSSSPESSNSDTRNFSDVLTPRSSRSDTSVDESLAPSLSPALSPVPTLGASAVSDSASASPQTGSLLKTFSTVSANGRRLKPKKILFPFDDFVMLFDANIEFPPCGLLNCGNSCFVNAVLQCFTYTQPLVAFLLCGDHGRQCKNTDWCFMCALQEHAYKVKQRIPFSPSGILSHLRSIGRSLNYGNQEDAHEFMSSAIHLMQSICLDEAGGETAVDSCTQQTTFTHHIFGGLLQSQVKCNQCHLQSNRYEVMMDLAVEIPGNVRSLEDALGLFTAPEILNGENKYKCNRCDAYVDACKQLTVHEAPNILVVTLKRFKGGRYGKLTNYVEFPEILDMTPYMSKNGDRPPCYNLYAVVVHVSESNAAHNGHYFSLVKNPNGYWYRADDSKVTEVGVDWVTSQEAYILLYKRSKLRSMDFADDTLDGLNFVAQDGYVRTVYATHSQPQYMSVHMPPWASPITDPYGTPFYFR